MSFTTLLPVWELVIPTLLGITGLKLIEKYLFKEKIILSLILYVVAWFVFENASRDLGWIFLFGICGYEFSWQIIKFKQNEKGKIVRLVFAICFLIFPILIPFGFIQAAKENNGVILFPKYAAAQIRSKISRTKSTMESVGEALEKYYTDNQAYPIPTPSYTLPNILTTPIAYLAKLPQDILVPEYPSLGYAVDTVRDKDIIASRGPDWVWQIDFRHFSYDVWTTGYLYQISYDPTNGSWSDGDIWRIMP